jgi:anti-anti-sigma factor
MRFRIGPGRDDRTLVLEGELDVSTAGRLAAAVELCSRPGGDVVLDCRGLTFIDGAGVRELASVAEGLPAGTTLILEGARGVVLRVLEMLRVDEHARLEVRPPNRPS